MIGFITELIGVGLLILWIVKADMYKIANSTAYYVSARKTWKPVED